MKHYISEFIDELRRLYNANVSIHYSRSLAEKDLFEALYDAEFEVFLKPESRYIFISVIVNTTWFNCVNKEIARKKFEEGPIIFARWLKEYADFKNDLIPCIYQKMQSGRKKDTFLAKIVIELLENTPFGHPFWDWLKSNRRFLFPKAQTFLNKIKSLSEASTE